MFSVTELPPCCFFVAFHVWLRLYSEGFGTFGVTLNLLLTSILQICAHTLHLIITFMTEMILAGHRLPPYSSLHVYFTGRNHRLRVKY